MKNQSPESAYYERLGKTLLWEAERIACEEFKVPQILVLGGVGARQYYQAEFGYNLVANYMVKKF